MERLRVGLAGIDVRKAREIVERVDQTMQQVRLGLGPELGALFVGTLTKIVVFGGQPEVTVLQLGELRLEAGHRLLGRLEQRSRRRLLTSRISSGRISPGRLLRRLGLFVVVLHGFALHVSNQYAVCRAPI